MENWTRKVNCRMEHEPIHPLISQKIRRQPDFSFRPFKYTSILKNVHGVGASMNGRPQTSLLPSFRGSGSSVATSMWQPAFVRSPLEDRKAKVLNELVQVGFARTIIAPLERVKLLMQSQNAMIKSGRLPQPYIGICDCFTRTIKNEGFFSLWRGNIAITMGHLSSMAIAFAISSAIVQYVESENLLLTYRDKLVIAGSSITTNLFLIYPLYYAGTRLASDVKTPSNTTKRQFNGILDVYRKTLKSDGIAGIYRGYSFFLAAFGLTAALLDASKLWLHSYLFPVQDYIGATFMVQYGIFVCCNLASYPMDTMSRRMMMTSGEADKYKNSLNAIAQILKIEGVNSFYKGAKAKVLVIAALNVSMVLVKQLEGVITAAMEKKPGDDGSKPGFSFNIRWKNPR